MHIVLGTAQFGQRYGVTNQDGAVTATKAETILNTAHQIGITHLDTAQLYGQSEAIIGQAKKRKFEIISKLAITDDGLSVEEKFQNSIKNLKESHIYGLLIHNSDIFKDSNKAIKTWKGLQELKAQGLVRKIGASFYTPEELINALKNYDFDIVQFPCSILDQRFLNADLQALLTEKNVEQHARSLFLQGVLLCNENSLPSYFQERQGQLKPYFELLKNTHSQPLELCFKFLKSIIKNKAPTLKAVVGVTSTEQLIQIGQTYKDVFDNQETPLDFDALASDNLKIIDPRQWNT